jgi:hypothetical protein
MTNFALRLCLPPISEVTVFRNSARIALQHSKNHQVITLDPVAQLQPGSNYILLTFLNEPLVNIINITLHGII